MKQWIRLLIPTMALSLVSPVTLWAADQEIETMEEVTPTFQDYQNAVQAERAANLAEATITDDDVMTLERDASIQADGYANSFAEEYANDQADQHVKDVSRNYANSVAEISPERDEEIKLEVDTLVQKQAEEYAISINEDVDSEEYKEAYEAAMSRATDPSFINLWDTTYKQLVEDELGSESIEFDDWLNAYDRAEQRATGGGENWVDARQTAYNEALKQFPDTEEYKELFGEAYDKALAEKMAELSGQRNQLVYEMRFIKKYGWGKITRELGLPPKYNGVGQWRKGMPVVEKIVAQPVLEELSIEEEIELATTRNTKTGWKDDPEFQTKGNKNKGSRKTYGLTQTSGLAGEDVRGNSKGNNGNGKNISSVGSSSKKGSSTDNQTAAPGKTKSNNGKKGGNKSNSSNNGNKGGKGNGNSKK